MRRSEVTVLRGVPTTGPYGSPDVDWSAPTLIGPYPADVQPFSTEERLADPSVVTKRKVWLWGSAADVTAADRVSSPDLPAGPWEVDGDPERWVQGSPRSRHVFLVVRRVREGG